MSDRITERRRLAEALYLERFDQELGAYVREQRAAGRSWRAIRDDVLMRSGGDIRLSDVALISWYGEPEPEPEPKPEAVA